MNIVMTRDMQTYVNEFKTSYAIKRTIYNDYQKEVSSRGFNFSKEMFVKEKYPRFPNRLRKILTTLL